MKRQRTLLGLSLLVLLLVLFCQASAAPVLSDENTTAWIGEDNCLSIMDNAGNIYHLPMLVKDILSFSDDSVYCRMQNQQIFAIKRNCSGSQFIQETAENLQDKRISLQNNILTLGTTAIPQVEAAATDGVHVAVLTLSADKRSLAVYTSDGKIWSDINDTLYIPDGSSIPEPQNMILAQNNLVITGKDHSIWICDLKSGRVQSLAATGNLINAAAYISGKLYLYTEDANHLWQVGMLDSGKASVQNTAAPVISLNTTVPTVLPTATPKKQAPSVTAEPENDNIRMWSSGSRVRNMQRRLATLGYPVGSIDGSYGEETRFAVNLFYDAIGYREHDYLSAAAEKKLFSKNAPVYDPFLPLKKGTQSTSVLLMQQRLAQLGYDPGKLDGIYGKQTAEALAQFQEISGIFSDENEKPGESASQDVLMHLYAENAPIRQTTPPVQWQETANGWICHLNGMKITGWRRIDNIWYYFNDDGIMQTGWIKKGNDWYYANSKGAMLTGWQQISGSWYYFNSSGKMQRGWFEDKQAEKKNKKSPMWYYLDDDGKMVTGERTINGKQEVFDQYGLWQYTR